MKQKPYSIGKVAKQSGFSIDTIRYYEQQGLLPEPERRASGFRYYDDSVFIRLRFIQNAKRLGFTLKEIEQLAQLSQNEMHGVKAIREQTQQHLDSIEAKIQKLKNIQQALTKLVNACPGHGSIDACPIVQALLDDAPLIEQ
jgi:MerR family transcriptional regulator, copper efflux regulator